MSNPSNEPQIMDEDNGLLDRCKNGEREAFDELVLKYQRQIYAMLYRMVSDHDDAADLLQRTFVKAFTGLGSFERRSSFKTWLYQIAINLAKNVYRDRARWQRIPLENITLGRDPKPLDRMIGAEDRSRLREAMADLPEKQRLTMLLRVQEGKKFDEIAEIMKCSLGTAKANYHHAVQKLKHRLGRKEGED